MNIPERIAALRALMKTEGLDAYITLNGDPHAGEYVARHYTMRTWLSGFTGSAGTLVVTMEKAALWTDGRYVVQAAKQLEGSGIEMVLIGGPGKPTMEEWLKSEIPGGCAGWWGSLISLSVARKLEEDLKSAGIRLTMTGDLTASIWTDRPPLPAAPVWEHPLEYTGEAAAQRINRVREAIAEKGANAQLIGRLEDIHWLFNIRGGDIDGLPVAYAWALVTRDTATLFTELRRVEKGAASMLKDNGVTLAEYAEIVPALRALPGDTVLAFDPKRVNKTLADSIACPTREQEDVTILMKAVKNPTEQAGIRESAVWDGVAMVKFLKWLEEADRSAETEYTAGVKLAEIRKTMPLCISTSFGTIAAYKDHGAMMHYSATPETAYTLDGNGMMVLDSGGQYLNGTTDITRTPVFGTLTRQETIDYTMTLKSHIALADTKFLKGASPLSLDAIARRPLWKLGIEYRCGTGHGVGYCLSVHEEPINFSQKGRHIPFRPGMLITIEPGVYREGVSGVRIENEVLVVEDEFNEYGQWYRFEPVTYCPIDLKGVDPSLLAPEELDYLNQYHQLVYDRLAPRLDEEERAWLAGATRRIG